VVCDDRGDGVRDPGGEHTARLLLGGLPLLGAGTRAQRNREEAREHDSDEAARACAAAEHRPHIPSGQW
jgi:hypothetical protein